MIFQYIILRAFVAAVLIACGGVLEFPEFARSVMVENQMPPIFAGVAIIQVPDFCAHLEPDVVKTVSYATPRERNVRGAGNK
ncbi:hypothetical protein F5Y11DRAFT_314767 [Daldinia sp. FL1419]|nr:hypothetical protein F5Y11DRAFT_314767 [Daldinia sp. FL1419]